MKKAILLAIARHIEVSIKDKRILKLLDLEYLKNFLLRNNFVEKKKDIGGSTSYYCVDDPNIVVYIVSQTNPNFNLFMQDNIKVLSKHLKKTELALVLDFLEGGINGTHIVGEVLQSNSAIAITDNAAN